MVNAGTTSDQQLYRETIQGNSDPGILSGQVIVNQYLALWGPSPTYARIGGIQAYARVAGVGAGNTVIDVLKNGTSIYPVHPANRPTLLGTSTGAFTCSRPDVLNVVPGDIIDIQVVTVPATKGHANVSVIVTLDVPQGAQVGVM